MGRIEGQADEGQAAYEVAARGRREKSPVCRRLTDRR
jgi:hypothetical protein